MRDRAARAKGSALRGLMASAAWSSRPHRPRRYRPGVTVVTVNWNALEFLRPMLEITRARSGPDLELLVVDNGSRDGSREYLASLDDVRTVRLPVNVGHGAALDVAVSRIDTELLAVLDVDAFPISDDWVRQSIAALDAGAVIAGARMHRNFIHPCFLVTRTPMLHELNLTFRPVGRLPRHSAEAPLFLDVGEALAQRVIIKHRSSLVLHPFEITATRGPGMTGTVFGDLVYHNGYSTQGEYRAEALVAWREAVERYRPR